MITLPGFLGIPHDWEILKKYSPLYLDIFDDKSFFPEKGLIEAGKTINAIAKTTPQQKVLIGYSLGGRLALHALIDDLSSWKAAVIVSANPGLQLHRDKESRLQKDRYWASQFRLKPWEAVMAAWNTQDVFNKVPIKRNEKDFSREYLAQILENWSLGNQADLRQAIGELDIPILWVTGENDTQFTSFAKSVLLSHPLSRKCEIKDAAHRILWEQKESFLQELETFLRH